MASERSSVAYRAAQAATAPVADEIGVTHRPRRPPVPIALDGQRGVVIVGYEACIATTCPPPALPPWSSTDHATSWSSATEPASPRRARRPPRPNALEGQCVVVVLDPAPRPRRVEPLRVQCPLATPSRTVQRGKQSRVGVEAELASSRRLRRPPWWAKSPGWPWICGTASRRAMDGVEALESAGGRHGRRRRRSRRSGAAPPAARARRPTVRCARRPRRLRATAPPSPGHIATTGKVASSWALPRPPRPVASTGNGGHRLQACIAATGRRRVVTIAPTGNGASWASANLHRATCTPSRRHRRPRRARRAVVLGRRLILLGGASTSSGGHFGSRRRCSSLRCTRSPSRCARRPIHPAGAETTSTRSSGRPTQCLNCSRRQGLTEHSHAYTAPRRSDGEINESEALTRSKEPQEPATVVGLFRKEGLDQRRAQSAFNRLVDERAVSFTREWKVVPTKPVP